MLIIYNLQYLHQQICFINERFSWDIHKKKIFFCINYTLVGTTFFP